MFFKVYVQSFIALFERTLKIKNIAVQGYLTFFLIPELLSNKWSETENINLMTKILRLL